MRALVLVALTSLVALSARPAVAQHPVVDASLGLVAVSWRAAFAVFWNVKLDRVSLGLGPRGSYFGGTANSYRAPDALAPGLSRRLRLAPDIWALNLGASVDLQLAGPISAGANLDLLGIAGGPSKRASGVKLTPASPSLFKYGDRDRGSLNSEFYLAVNVKPDLRFRAGISHYLTGYRVATASAASRYLRFDTVPFVGIRWAP